MGAVCFSCEIWTLSAPLLVFETNFLTLFTFLRNTPIFKGNSLFLDHMLYHLTFWHRNYFFLILAPPVYKMLIIQEPNKLEL